MRKIRQHNDIDIVVKLKNDEGAVLDATLIKEYKVFLTQVGYRLRIEDYQILPDGGIGFRFHAANQRIGVYSIVVTAVTTDDRVFTTDVCNAFALVRCSCDAEDGSSDAEIEALEVNATFEITAWGGGDNGGDVQTSLKYYDDGSGEVVPVKHPDLSTQPSILPYKFAGNYVYEQMFYVTSKQIGESLDTGHIVELGKTEIQNVLVIDSFISGVFMFGDGTFNRTNTVPSSFIIMGTANSIELHVQSLEDAVAIIDEGLESCWIRVVYTTKPKAGEYYYASEQRYGSIIIGFGSSEIAEIPIELLIGDRTCENGYFPVTIYPEEIEKFLAGEIQIAFRQKANYNRDILVSINNTNEEIGVHFSSNIGDFSLYAFAQSAPEALMMLKNGKEIHASITYSE